MKDQIQKCTQSGNEPFVHSLLHMSSEVLLVVGTQEKGGRMVEGKSLSFTGGHDCFLTGAGVDPLELESTAEQTTTVQDPLEWDLLLLLLLLLLLSLFLLDVRVKVDVELMAG